MGPINKDLILKDIPLFSGLTSRELNLIKEKCNFVEYKKGEVIYKEGSPADAFYCVLLGRVMIYTQDRFGKDTVLEYLHRGKYFGIISLLTGENHSVSSKAINDCMLLVIRKEDFDLIIKKIPVLAIDLSQTLSRRLKNKDLHQKTIFESTVVSAFSSYSAAGKTVFALNLALSLNKETHRSVAILDIASKGKAHSLPAKLGIGGDYRVMDLCGSPIDPANIKGFVSKTGFNLDLICVAYSPDEEACVKRLVAILSVLVNDYHYIILDLPSVMDSFVFSMLNQSDIIHILTSPEPVYLKRTRRLIDRLKTEFHFQEAKLKVLINEYRLSKLDYQEQAALLDHPIFATLPKIEFGAADRIILDNPDCEYAKVIRRISRRIGDCLVGLALGVGVAYGFCHIGVLKVIEDEKIPIDVIAGSSIGALIAGLWALGKSSDEILEITGEFREQKHIWGLIDLTIPSLGFIKGKKFYNFLKKHFGNKTFHDVKLPLKIVASDIRIKEPKVFDKGPLIEAMMATCAMPGVFTPFKLREEMLFDGGVINPLPTEVLFKAGVRKIIAVNVTPSREDILRHLEDIKKQITTKPERKARWFSIKDYFRNRFKTNILDIIFSSFEVMQSEVIQKEAQLADIVLHPDMTGLHWLELHKSRDFAKRGEEEARKNLDKIWQVINE